MNNNDSIWHKTLEQHPEANFLQSPAYGELTRSLGDDFALETFDKTGYALMLIRDARRGRYLEIPCGPLLNWQDKTAVRAAFKTIETIAKSKKCVFVRVRPQLLNTPENLALLKSLGLKKAPMHLAAEHTVILDLKKSEEELLADLRRQTRYEVRRSGKQGIIVEKARSKALFEEFYKVQQETARRQNFVPPSLKTLLAEREFLDSEIYIARTAPNTKTETTIAAAKTAKATEVAKTAENSPNNPPIPSNAPIAYGLIIKSGKEADYYEAASTNLNRKLPGAYALLWQAIKDLKAEGYERFNLWGIAPKNQPRHRYAGVTTFKTGFGGEIVEFVPAHDLVLSKTKYLKNWVIEEARKKRRHL